MKLARVAEESSRRSGRCTSSHSRLGHCRNASSFDLESTRKADSLLFERNSPMGLDSQKPNGAICAMFHRALGFEGRNEDGSRREGPESVLAHHGRKIAWRQRNQS